jgi:hypothetical protein
MRTMYWIVIGCFALVLVSDLARISHPLSLVSAVLAVVVIALCAYQLRKTRA